VVAGAAAPRHGVKKIDTPPRKVDSGRRGGEKVGESLLSLAYLAGKAGILFEGEGRHAEEENYKGA